MVTLVKDAGEAESLQDLARGGQIGRRDQNVAVEVRAVAAIGVEPGRDSRPLQDDGSHPGFDAWALLQRGRTADEIASVIESRYAGGTDRAAVRADTYEVLGKLYEAGVIVQDASAGSDPVAESADDLPEEDRPYQRPILERYTDMQEYLLADPIHGVDERGWPAGTAASG